MDQIKYKWRVLNKERIKAQFQLELRDIWVGIFWRTVHRLPFPYYTLHLFICFIPFIPLHITILIKEHAD